MPNRTKSNQLCRDPAATVTSCCDVATLKAVRTGQTSVRRTSAGALSLGDGCTITSRRNLRRPAVVSSWQPWLPAGSHLRPRPPRSRRQAIHRLVACLACRMRMYTTELRLAASDIASLRCGGKADRYRRGLGINRPSGVQKDSAAIRAVSRRAHLVAAFARLLRLACPASGSHRCNLAGGRPAHGTRHQQEHSGLLQTGD